MVNAIKLIYPSFLNASENNIQIGTFKNESSSSEKNLGASITFLNLKHPL